MTDDTGYESGLPGFHFAHLLRKGNQLDLIGERLETRKSLYDPTRCGRLGTQLTGAAQGFFTIATFQTHASPHAGYGIDDQAYFFWVGCHIKEMPKFTKCLKCLKLRYSINFNEPARYKPRRIKKLISPI
jgi:hypothetical protein